MSPQDDLCQKYDTLSTLVEVMQRKLWPLFPDTVYNYFRFSPLYFRVSVVSKSSPILQDLQIAVRIKHIYRFL